MASHKALTSIKEQFEIFSKTKNVHDSKLEEFEIDSNLDCYNPSIPFVIDETEYILCRTQERKGEYSKVYCFKKEDSKWVIEKSFKPLPLEDPSIAFINDKIVVSGVNVTFGDNINTFTEWKTDFYVGDSIQNLEYFTSGPDHMKDIRLVQLKNSKIGIFTRPLGKNVADGHKAKIGFTIVDRIEDINKDVINNAPLLDDFFLKEEWGGCNSAYLLKNGLIGVIGHKSYYSNEDGKDHLHYYGTYFVINPKTYKTTDMNIIISRDCFPYFEPREERLTDITFTSGIVRNSDGTAKIYAGLSDSAIGSAIIKDPFIEYEKLKV